MKSTFVLTPQGHKIKFYFSSEFYSEKETSKVLFVGGVHGDEPWGVVLAESLLEWLKNLKVEKAQIEWGLIPCLNIYGYQNNTRTNENGVDLNRNYPSRTWRSQAHKDRYYPGPNAESESEVKWIVEIIQSVNPVTVVHFHSWKPCIVKTGEDPLCLSEKFHRSSQYEIVKTIGYETPGSLSEYVGRDLKKTVICIEEDDETQRESIWPRWKPGFEEILL